MTVLYSYKVQPDILNNQLNWQPHTQYNVLNSLDEVPKTLERPSVVLLDGHDPSLQLVVEKLYQIQPNLTPLVLIQNGCSLSFDAKWQDKVDVFYYPNTNSKAFETQLARSFHCSQLMLQKNQANMMDELSGLFSYGYFVRRAKEEMALASRHKTPLVCVVIKFAFYEAYLDSYGFDFIEALYGKLADKIKSTIRQEDVAARLGNDEIGLLLPRSNEIGARVLIERLVQQASEIEVEGEFNGNENIFLFAGIAEYPSPDMEQPDADTLLRFARHALHQARSHEDSPVQLFSQLKPANFGNWFGD